MNSDGELIKRLDKIIEDAENCFDGEHCPEGLIKHADTPYERNSAMEIIKLFREILVIKKDINWIKWLTIALFTTYVIGQLNIIFGLF